MGRDPLVGYTSTNYSVLRPYGVWLVISPFNFPDALTGGPAGAALVAGNTIVIKPATDTPWSVRLLAECFRDAGLPDGAVNFVTGPGRTLGQALIDSPKVAPHHPGAGRQEPGHCLSPRRPGAGSHRHYALGIRPAGPEVLGLLTGIH
jgi:hypothetical protein